MVLKLLAKQQEQVIDNSKPTVVDGTNLIAGRLCSNVAKLLRNGNRVSIVNCEKIMISGKKSSIIGEYEDFLKIHSIIHPQHGPFHPRRPDTIIKRMIRGMLPKESKSLERIQFEKSKIKKSPSNYTSMAELSRYIGGTDF